MISQNGLPIFKRFVFKRIDEIEKLMKNEKKGKIMTFYEKFLFEQKIKIRDISMSFLAFDYLFLKFTITFWRVFFIILKTSLRFNFHKLDVF